MPDPETVHFLHMIIEDDTYKAMQDRFIREGKGRRPDISAPPLTNRVFVQLWDLMLHSQFEQSKVVEWFMYLFPDHIFDGTDRLRHQMSAVYSKATQLSSQGAGDVASFLDISIHFSHTSNALMQIGLDRIVLLGSARNFNRQQDVIISNEIVLDLDMFQQSENLPSSFASEWICVLLNYPCDVKTIKNIAYRLSKAKVQRQRLRLKKSNESLKQFLMEQFSPPQLSVVNNDKINKCDHDKEIKSLSKALVEADNAKSVFDKKVKILHSLLDEEKNKTVDLETKLQQASAEKMELEQTLLQLRGDVDTASSLKEDHEKVVRHLSRVHEAAVTSLKEREDFLVKKVSRLRVGYKEKCKEVHNLKTVIGQFQYYDDTCISIDLKVKGSYKNTYSEPVRQTAIALQGETGVSADNVKNVIAIVSKYLFNKTFKDASLPCGQTCINMLDEALVLSNMQVSEKVLDSNNVTLHSDGTSRDGKKIVGHQITLDSGEQLYLGFKPVAMEDSQTLLDILIKALQDISHSFDCLHERSSTFHDLMSKITSLMSDRAAAMKLFDHKFSEFLKSASGQDIHVHFLHCNAHFLLGLSSACEKGLSFIEKEFVDEKGEYFGRDKIKDKFSSFYKEKTAATNRVIRTMCEVLGPRGDQKSGCRQEWITFCPESKIPSFKSNRFNCFFQASAAIILHYDKLKTFFTSGILNENLNLKLQSVSYDLQDNNLMCFVGAVALFYLKISDPYWNLVTSKTKYCDFHLYVKQLQSSLKNWSENPDEMCHLNNKSVFTVSHDSHSPFYDVVHNFVNRHDMSLVHRVLKSLCSHSLVVTERQLADFLTDKYSKFDDTTREILDHCPLTNLIGESAFGDYDFDLSRRRHASLHNRSALHAVKRNKTMHYLDKKSPAEKRKMFHVARKLGPELRKVDKALEDKVTEEIQTKFLSNQQKKIDKELSSIERNSKIVNDVKKYGGPCRSSEDIDYLHNKLINENKSSKAINEIFKCEIRFHKNIGGISSLKFGDTSHMIDLLKNCLPDDSDLDLSPPSKRQRT